MNEKPAQEANRWLYIFIGVAVLINFTGLFVTVMGPDGALYASISRTIAENNNFTDLFVQGKDWLDKPHFPFWITALSFKIFGVATWSYKLPGILFVLLAAYYTYKFASALYHQTVGLWAALILLTAQHIIICTMDVRAEPYLTGLIIASVYHFYKSLGIKWFWNLVLASVFAACAVMTKGVFALVPIAGAIGGHLIITRNWKMVFNFRWLLALLMIFLFIMPELHSLYMQFDLHPEKVVFGHQNNSGLKFFFWDSQFGRFFNNGPIKKSKGDPTFFLHTILWAYLPWCLLFYTAIYQFFKTKARQVEWFCVSASLITLLMFSLSKFQLPFYIVIVFPFFSIITAQYLCQVKSERSVKAINITQRIIAGLMIAVVLLLQWFFRPEQLSITLIILMLGSVMLFLMVSAATDTGRYKALFQVCTAVFIVNLYFNLAYYPTLLKYQADSEAAFWLNTNNPKNLPVVQTRVGFGYGLDFYLNGPLYFLHPGEEKTLPVKPYLIYGEKEFLDEYLKGESSAKQVKSFDNFRISRLNGKFLNHKTRSQAVTKTQIFLIK